MYIYGGALRKCVGLIDKIVQPISSHLRLLKNGKHVLGPSTQEAWRPVKNLRSQLLLPNEMFERGFSTRENLEDAPRR